VIDEAFARTVYPDQDPLGTRIHFNYFDHPVDEIGVVGHVKQGGLDVETTARGRLQLYLPYLQAPDIIASDHARSVNVVVRVSVPTAHALASIRTTLRTFDSSQAISHERGMEDVIANSLAGRRFSLDLLSTFAGIALILSLVGTYGVTSYVVTQRTHDLGIRLALGAQRWDILRLVLSEGGHLAAIGIVFGLVASVGLTRFFASLLFDISATDPLTFGGVAVLLLIVTLGACYVPARRAARVDLIAALRFE
jgi:predicted lysophospholipase L1 biosynthesis ABC-type transport system permease subunit